MKLVGHGSSSNCVVIPTAKSIESVQPVEVIIKSSASMSLKDFKPKNYPNLPILSPNSRDSQATLQIMECSDDVECGARNENDVRFMSNEEVKRILSHTKMMINHRQ